MLVKLARRGCRSSCSGCGASASAAAAARVPSFFPTPPPPLAPAPPEASRGALLFFATRYFSSSSSTTATTTTTTTGGGGGAAATAAAAAAAAAAGPVPATATAAASASSPPPPPRPPTPPLPSLPEEGGEDEDREHDDDGCDEYAEQLELAAGGAERLAGVVKSARLGSAILARPPRPSGDDGVDDENDDFDGIDEDSGGGGNLSELERTAADVSSALLALTGRLASAAAQKKKKKKKKKPTIRTGSSASDIGIDSNDSDNAPPQQLKDDEEEEDHLRSLHRLFVAVATFSASVLEKSNQNRNRRRQQQQLEASNRREHHRNTSLQLLLRSILDVARRSNVELSLPFHRPLFRRILSASAAAAGACASADTDEAAHAEDAESTSELAAGMLVEIADMAIGREVGGTAYSNDDGDFDGDSETGSSRNSRQRLLSDLLGPALAEVAAGVGTEEGHQRDSNIGSRSIGSDVGFLVRVLSELQRRQGGTGTGIGVDDLEPRLAANLLLSVRDRARDVLLGDPKGGLLLPEGGLAELAGLLEPRVAAFLDEERARLEQLEDDGASIEAALDRLGAEEVYNLLATLADVADSSDEEDEDGQEVEGNDEERGNDGCLVIDFGWSGASAQPRRGPPAARHSNPVDAVVDSILAGGMSSPTGPQMLRELVDSASSASVGSSAEGIRFDRDLQGGYGDADEDDLDFFDVQEFYWRSSASPEAPFRLADHTKGNHPGGDAFASSSPWVESVFPDVTRQVESLLLPRGRRLQLTEEYEESVWTRYCRYGDEDGGTSSFRSGDPFDGDGGQR